MDVMFYFVIWAIVFVLMTTFRFGAAISGSRPVAASKDGNRQNENASQIRWSPPEKDLDPVCGMTVQTAIAKPSFFNGLVSHFCSRDCHERLEAAPASYLATSANNAIIERGRGHG